MLDACMQGKGPTGSRGPCEMASGPLIFTTWDPRVPVYQIEPKMTSCDAIRASFCTTYRSGVQQACSVR